MDGSEAAGATLGRGVPAAELGDGGPSGAAQSSPRP